ncbi:MAG TPA: amino acid permease [Candidatus Aquilonibacter sp.]|nr:amino acid permease [Candidatus Aquilonibacter sp.]
MLLQRVKPLARLLAETEDQQHSLKKTLGPGSLIAMGIGAIIGTGIFVLTGVAAAKYTGPSLTISFIVAGFVSAFAALCYSEVASRVPIAGSAYTFAYASLGELIAWIIGWDLVLEYALGASTVSVGWSGYFFTVVKNITGFEIPQSLMHNPWDLGPSGEPMHGIMNLPAFCIILLIGFLLYRGTRESAIVNNIIVTIKVCIVLFFIAIGVGHINNANWTPYFPYSIGGTLFGAFFVFFAYIGFDAVSTAAEESKNPKKDMPIGIIGSLAICTILYIIVAAILTGMVNFKSLNVPQPVAYAVDQVGLHWAGALIALGAIAGLTTVLLVMMFGQTRVFFAMSRDGLLPSFFSRVHPKFRTPGVTTVIFTIIIAIVGSLTPISILGELTNTGTLFAFILVSIALPILRKKYPTTQGYEVPGGPYLIPVISTVLSAILFLAPAWSPLMAKASGFELDVKYVAGLPLPLFAFLTWMVIGLVVYFAYGRGHSLVGKEEKSSLNA